MLAMQGAGLEKCGLRGDGRWEMAEPSRRLASSEPFFSKRGMA
jgi:hypothetical protein